MLNGELTVPACVLYCHYDHRHAPHMCKTRPLNQGALNSEQEWMCVCGTCAWAVVYLIQLHTSDHTVKHNVLYINQHKMHKHTRPGPLQRMLPVQYVCGDALYYYITCRWHTHIWTVMTSSQCQFVLCKQKNLKGHRFVIVVEQSLHANDRVLRHNFRGKAKIKGG